MKFSNFSQFNISKKSLIIFIFLFAITTISIAQTPQYNNGGTSPVGNSLPFGSALAANGYKCQWLIGPGEFNLPSPAPAGNNITKFYIYISTGGTGTYTNLTIKLGQTNVTSLPPNSYSGQLDTVYFRASGSLTTTTNTWLSFTLDKTFSYDPTKSLVIDISHCGISGAGFSVWQWTGNAGVFRRNPIPGTPACVFTYSAQDTRILQCGIDLAPPPVSVTSPCRNGVNKSIPDASPTGIQDTIIVNIPTAGNILDINVKVDTLNHTWDSDMDVTLIHGAIEDTLFHDVGSSGDNFIGCILNDSATTAIQTCTTPACAPFTGSWIPPNLLANMNGTSANGLYILRCVDDLGGDVGTLQAWCITVTYQTITGNIETTTIPSKYSLKQNYPNPFNPSTKISFNLPKASDVKLVIYDLLGREVKTLVNEYKQAGIYDVNFDGAALSSGVYFYKIVAGDFTDTKKMLLVK